MSAWSIGTYQRTSGVNLGDEADGDSASNGELRCRSVDYGATVPLSKHGVCPLCEDGGNHPTGSGDGSYFGETGTLISKGSLGFVAATDDERRELAEMLGSPWLADAIPRPVCPNLSRSD